MNPALAIAQSIAMIFIQFEDQKPFESAFLFVKWIWIFIIFPLLAAAVVAMWMKASHLKNVQPPTSPMEVPAAGSEAAPRREGGEHLLEERKEE